MMIMFKRNAIINLAFADDFLAKSSVGEQARFDHNNDDRYPSPLASTS